MRELQATESWAGPGNKASQNICTTDCIGCSVGLICIGMHVQWDNLYLWFVNHVIDRNAEQVA